MASKKKPTGVSAGELGKVLGIGDRWVRELSDQGVMVKLAYGRFDLAQSVQGYVAFKVESEVGKVGITTTEDDLKRERMRKLQLANDVTAKALMSVADALAAIDAIVGPIKTDLSALPARITDDVPMRRKAEDAIDTVIGNLARRTAKAGTALRAGSDALAADEADDA